VNINLNFGTQLLLKGQEMLVVLLESGGCTVRYVENILFLCVCLYYAIYTDGCSKSGESYKQTQLISIVYVASHAYESACFMNWPNFCPCFACSHLLAISQTGQKSRNHPLQDMASIYNCPMYDLVSIVFEL
jgi:hypothetical protein